MEETNYLKWAVEGLLSMLLALLGFNATRSMKRIDGLEKAQSECKSEYAKLELEVNKNYVAKAEYAQTMGRLFDEIKDVNRNILKLTELKQDKH